MNYNFWNPVNHTGSLNPRAKINEDIAHNICVLLTTTSMSHGQIAIRTRSSRHIVRQIARGKTWTHISRYFNLPNKK